MPFGRRPLRDPARAPVAKVRVPAALAIALLGGSACETSSSPRDAATGDGLCAVLCIPNGIDAGVCPSNPYVCVSADRTCPAGCDCTAYCFPRTAQGEQNCPTDDGLDCAAPDRTCPEGCDPVG